MSEHVRGRLLTTLWLMALVCVGSLGCTAQVSFLGGSSSSSPPGATVLRDTTGDRRPDNGTGQSFVRTNYETPSTARGQSPAAGLPRVSAMPDLRPAEGPALPRTPDTLPNPNPADDAPLTLGAASDADENAPAPAPAPAQTSPARQAAAAAPAAPRRAPGWTVDGADDGNVMKLSTGAEEQEAEAREEAGDRLDMPRAMPGGGPAVDGAAAPRMPALDGSDAPQTPAPAVPAEVAAAPVAMATAGPGCLGCAGGMMGGPDGMADRPLPNELWKVSHPAYRIEPPDILLLDAIRMVPRPPYVVQPLDVLTIQVTGTRPDQPINGIFTVSPDGTISLGFGYGLVRVSGMTLEQVQATIKQQLGRVLTNPQVAVALTQFRGMQQLRGEHLVRQDGTISLGTYGCVYVTGLTICQAKAVIEKHLAQYVLDPEVSVDVFAYNSKVYYIIVDGAGYGQQVYRLPITGNETVLDAISLIQGLPAVASRKKIWVARPAPCNHACTQILPVDWMAITQAGSTCTNYQLFPGDRIYIHSDFLICLDNAIAKVLSPIERILGVTLLTGATIQTFRNNNNNNNNNGAIIVP